MPGFVASRTCTDNRSMIFQQEACRFNQSQKYIIDQGSLVLAPCWYYTGLEIEAGYKKFSHIKKSCRQMHNFMAACPINRHPAKGIVPIFAFRSTVYAALQSKYGFHVRKRGCGCRRIRSLGRPTYAQQLLCCVIKQLRIGLFHRHQCSAYGVDATCKWLICRWCLHNNEALADYGTKSAAKMGTSSAMCIFIIHICPHFNL